MNDSMLGTAETIEWATPQDFFLLPARTDTVWFHEYCAFAEVRLLRGRLTFGGSESPAPFPSMLVIFHAYLDPGETIKVWDWKAVAKSQEVLQFA